MMQRLLFLLILVAIQPRAFAQYGRITNLPAVRIDTYDGQSVTDKQAYKLCSLVYTDEQDHVTRYDSVGIRGRGNSTWLMSKKPYRIKFNHKEKFLGRGHANAKSWTLLANAADKSMIRNALTSALGDWLGLTFNPAYKFVDLYLNGEYEGTYQISDQVQVKSHRVDIYEQGEPIDDDTSDISGGYLLEVDNFHDFTDGKTGFVTSGYKVPIRVHSPDEDVIGSRQLEYIRSYINAFEDRLSGELFADASRGYRPFVDSISLANWYLATEVSANVDGFFSTYFYKERDDSLLYWGPLWDYDIAYNNDNRTDRGTTAKRTCVTTYQLMSDVGYAGAKTWVNRLWEDVWFGRLVSRRFECAISDGLEAYMTGMIDSLATLLSQSQELNYEKWGINKRVYHEIVLYSTYDEYISSLKRFVSAHLKYLSSEFPRRISTDTPMPTPPFEPDSYYYRIYNYSTGHALDIRQDLAVTNADDSSNMIQEWWIRPTGDSFMIINRKTGKALSDPSEGVTATTGLPRQLNMVVPDGSDDRQLWTFTPQGVNGQYNIINVSTCRTVNLGGGSSAADAPVLSYVSDTRNTSSGNRLWQFTKTDPLPDHPTGILQVEAPVDYALAYNPVTGQLHFGSDRPENLTFTATVYTASGMRVGQFRAHETFSMQGFPQGVYIIKWPGHSHKFQK